MKRWEKGFDLLMRDVKKRVRKAKATGQRGRPARKPQAFDHCALESALGNGA